MKRISLLMVIICIGMLFAANQCNRENCHNEIPFINNSDKVLYVMGLTYSSDTLFYIGNWLTTPSNNHKVEPNSTNTHCLSRRAGNCYDVVPITRIFIFEEQVILSTPRDTIQQNYMILQRYDLTPEDLELLNWEVPYPPNERMKNMKMYPPYEE